ncbi:hypothetical protein PtrM4_060880 [Pyrenophora tritici-repentis]|uniref:Uncharacterized protein n=1 Tax=Pyrenophora tritici-repentis TaxID=45151 RepID=A0A834VSJ8_9PLEO|nr:hypothetical protein PtrM4_060880 [Pyrenophora tritici-repentis]
MASLDDNSGLPALAYEVKARELQCLIEDGKRAQFGLVANNQHHGDNPTFKKAVGELAKTVAFGELGYLKNISSETSMWQFASLGHYHNDIYNSGLVFDLEEHTLVFEWKAFLDDFYKDTTYVNARKQIKTLIGERAEVSQKHP